MQWTAADERFHEADASARWHESWWFDFAAPDGSLAGWVHLSRFPVAGRSSYHAFLVRPGEQVLAVVDDEIGLGTRSLEFRSDGLWGDHICETPFVHWTIGLEAFALGVDDPIEVIGRAYGDLVPLGFDLEWECDDPPVSGSARWGDGYRQEARVSGEILVGDQEIDFVGTGARAHSWGQVDWWSTRWPAEVEDDPAAVTLVRVADPAGGDDALIRRSLIVTGDTSRWIDSTL